MRVSIDKAGRVVVPKQLRDELGFSPGHATGDRRGQRTPGALRAPRAGQARLRPPRPVARRHQRPDHRRGRATHARSRARAPVTQAADSSIAIAALLDGHPAHDEAADALATCKTTIAHAAIETYSVLTRLPPPNQADATTTAELLAERLPSNVRRAERKRTLQSGQTAGRRRRQRRSDIRRPDRPHRTGARPENHHPRQTRRAHLPHWARPTNCSLETQRRTVGWPGALQPPAPTDPGVTVSRHRALLISVSTQRTHCHWANRRGSRSMQPRPPPLEPLEGPQPLDTSSQPSASGRC